jgi:Tol biopolymer transport system component
MNSISCISLRFSPDGSTIAFTASVSSARFNNIYTIPLSGGAPHRLTADGDCLADLMWTADGKSIVFVSTRSRLSSLWRVSVNGDRTEHETTYPAIGSFSREGRRFVYAEQISFEAPAIWRALLASAGGQVVDNRKLIQTQFTETDAQPSPDGRRIAWASDRTGLSEIWISDATGGNPLQLTHLEGISGKPRWSPDGNWIAFNSPVDKRRQIFVVNPEGRNLHLVTDGYYENIVPFWSWDGKSLYFTSDRTGSWQLWKHSLATGSEIQLTKQGETDHFESFDGQIVYFSKLDRAGIWSIPSNGGTESLVVADKPQIGYWGNWAVSKAGLYLLNVEAEPRPRIEFYGFATRRITPVLTFEKQPVRHHLCLSATADGKTIYYTQYDQQSVIKMMEFSR